MARESTTNSSVSDVLVIVTAYNEADRIGATLKALGDGFPGAQIWVADDGSDDETSTIATACGANVIAAGATIGKGAAATCAGVALLGHLDGAPSGTDPVVVLCDGDLGVSAARLRPLVQAIATGEADLSVGDFAKKIGGGFGLTLRYARRSIHKRCQLLTHAPISGQRAMRAGTLRGLLPFADGFGMEVGMTIDAVRAGLRVVEVEVDLEHRVTGRTIGGFVHRGRQLIDIWRANWARR